VLYNRKTQKLTLNPHAEYNSQSYEEVFEARFQQDKGQRCKSESDADDKTDYVWDDGQQKYTKRVSDHSEISGYRRKVMYEVRSDDDIDNDHLLLEVLKGRDGEHEE
jgi:hypothetical protein